MKLVNRFQAQAFLTTVLMAQFRCNAESTDIDDTDRIDLSAYGTRIYGKPQKSAAEAVRQWHRAQQQEQHRQKSQPQSQLNPEELGPYAEGDILVPRKPNAGRNGMLSDAYRWRDGVVPFEIVGSFNANEMELIENAINAYHEHTCIKFTPRTRIEPDFISIQNGNSGCWSSVGRIGGRQVVNLQSHGCLVKVGTVIHELMHAVGFLHEQNREERDQFVDIRLENVRKGYEVNFERAASGTSSGFGASYDYGSVMHYSEGAFSTNGQPTIVPKHSEAIGQRDGFSQLDIKKIQNMYKCTKTTSSTGYKPSLSLTPLITAGGVGDIWNMIVPTDVSRPAGKKR